MGQANVAGLQQPAADAGLRADTAERRYPIEFTATTGQYFRIWIVNLALTIVTLGIYSAWAKVRRRRYFYGCTRIDGEGFEYRANPVAILKGRLIALAVFGVFYVAGQFSPLLQVALWIPLAVIAPWLIVRSLAFNAYNSAYRNIRLRFDGTYGRCLKIILGYGLLMLVTLGLAYPYFKRRLVQFAIQHHAYGTTRFAISDAFKKPFIHGYAVAYGLGVLLGLLVFGGIGVLGFMARGGEREAAAGLAALMPLLIIVFYGGLFLLFAYVKARTTNAVWNNVAIGPVRFESALRARSLIWIYLSNIVAVVFTLGLLTPWAVVRLMRYRASRVTVVAAGALDSYVQAEAQQVGSAGEEVAEMFDIDIGL